MWWEQSAGGEAAHLQHHRRARAEGTGAGVLHGHPQPSLLASPHAARAPAMVQPLAPPAPLFVLLVMPGAAPRTAGFFTPAHTRAHAHSLWAAALHNASPLMPGDPSLPTRRGRGGAPGIFPNGPRLQSWHFWVPFVEFGKACE